MSNQGPVQASPLGQLPQNLGTTEVRSHDTESTCFSIRRKVQIVASRSLPFFIVAGLATLVSSFLLPPLALALVATGIFTLGTAASVYLSYKALSERSIRQVPADSVLPHLNHNFVSHRQRSRLPAINSRQHQPAGSCLPPLGGTLPTSSPSRISPSAGKPQIIPAQPKSVAMRSATALSSLSTQNVRDPQNIRDTTGTVPLAGQQLSSDNSAFFRTITNQLFNELRDRSVHDDSAATSLDSAYEKSSASSSRSLYDNYNVTPPSLSRLPSGNQGADTVTTVDITEASLLSRLNASGDTTDDDETSSEFHSNSHVATPLRYQREAEQPEIEETDTSVQLQNLSDLEQPGYKKLTPTEPNIHEPGSNLSPTTSAKILYFEIEVERKGNDVHVVFGKDNSQSLQFPESRQRLLLKAEEVINQTAVEAPTSVLASVASEPVKFRLSLLIEDDTRSSFTTMTVFNISLNRDAFAELLNNQKNNSAPHKLIFNQDQLPALNWDKHPALKTSSAQTLSIQDADPLVAAEPDHFAYSSQIESPSSIASKANRVHIDKLSDIPEETVTSSLDSPKKIKAPTPTNLSVNQLSSEQNLSPSNSIALEDITASNRNQHPIVEERFTPSPDSLEETHISHKSKVLEANVAMQAEAQLVSPENTVTTAVESLLPEQSHNPLTETVAATIDDLPEATEQEKTKLKPFDLFKQSLAGLGESSSKIHTASVGQKSQDDSEIPSEEIPSILTHPMADINKQAVLKNQRQTAEANEQTNLNSAFKCTKDKLKNSGRSDYDVVTTAHTWVVDAEKAAINANKGLLNALNRHQNEKKEKAFNDVFFSTARNSGVILTPDELKTKRPLKSTKTSLGKSEKSDIASEEEVGTLYDKAIALCSGLSKKKNIGEINPYQNVKDKPETRRFKQHYIEKVLKASSIGACAEFQLLVNQINTHILNIQDQREIKGLLRKIGKPTELPAGQEVNLKGTDVRDALWHVTANHCLNFFVAAEKQHGRTKKAESTSGKFNFLLELQIFNYKFCLLEKGVDEVNYNRDLPLAEKVGQLRTLRNKANKLQQKVAGLYKRCDEYNLTDSKDFILGTSIPCENSSALKSKKIADFKKSIDRTLKGFLEIPEGLPLDYLQENSAAVDEPFVILVLDELELKQCYNSSKLFSTEEMISGKAAPTPTLDDCLKQKTQQEQAILSKATLKLEQLKDQLILDITRNSVDTQLQLKGEKYFKFPDPEALRLDPKDSAEQVFHDLVEKYDDFLKKAGVTEESRRKPLLDIMFDFTHQGAFAFHQNLCNNLANRYVDDLQQKFEIDPDFIKLCKFDELMMLDAEDFPRAYSIKPVCHNRRVGFNIDQDEKTLTIRKVYEGSLELTNISNQTEVSGSPREVRIEIQYKLGLQDASKNNVELVTVSEITVNGGQSTAQIPVVLLDNRHSKQEDVKPCNTNFIHRNINGRSR